MAKNDIILLDSLIEKSKTSFTNCKDNSELFEFFSFDQILKEFSPSIDELETGWTDGSNDGGIDGFFIYVDQRIATFDIAEYALKKSPNIVLDIITAKTSSSFKQDPVDKLISSLGELLDLRKNVDDLHYTFNERIITQRELFLKVFKDLADRNPELTIRLHYCCRGDKNELADNIVARSKNLTETINNLFSDVSIEMNFVDASHLLNQARKTPDFKIKFPYTDSYISREGSNYIFLCTLPDYYKAVCDKEGNLRRYLFESNVRDYLGNGRIAQDIAATLSQQQAENNIDFWWLNNGVTIIGEKSQIIAKELVVDNAQIVNGLQTTETLFHEFSENYSTDDKRAILIKVISETHENVRKKIIKATNYQNSVETYSLRGLDEIQKNIEDYLIDFNWFYDRKKNYYKNLGKPAARIISIPYLAAAVRAIAICDPAGSPQKRSRTFRNDDAYHTVFNTKWDLKVFLICIEITREIEIILNSRRHMINAPTLALVHFIANAYTVLKLQNNKYSPEDILDLYDNYPTANDVDYLKNKFEEHQLFFSKKKNKKKKFELIISDIIEEN